jgi:heptosyltransferase-3
MPSSPARILIIQLRQLGDILMITPLARQLKKRFPQASIRVLCEGIGKQLLEHNPHLEAPIILPKAASAGKFVDCLKQIRAWGPDWVIDAQALPKTALLARLSGAEHRTGFGGRWWRAVCYNQLYTRYNSDYSALDKLKLAGSAFASPLNYAELALDFPVATADSEWAEAFCRRHFTDEGKLNACLPGSRQRYRVAALFGVSRRAYKVWPPEHLAKVGRWLTEQELRPMLVYGPGEEDAARELAAQIGQRALVDYEMPNFAQLREILARCALFVGNDGGPKHLAALSGTPSLTLFGYVHPEAWTDPTKPNQRWLATASDTRQQPTTGPCESALRLAEISPERVIAELERLLVEWGIQA